MTMVPSTADAVVIGGGILGTATAHFLSKKHFGKVVLLEKTLLAAVSRSLRESLPFNRFLSSTT